MGWDRYREDIQGKGGISQGAGKAAHRGKDKNPGGASEIGDRHPDGIEGAQFQDGLGDIKTVKPSEGNFPRNRLIEPGKG